MEKWEEFILLYRLLLFLVNCIRNDWQLWESSNELKILRNHAEIGRKYTIIYFRYIFGAVIVFIVSTFVPCLLDVVIPLNETRPLKPVYPVKFFFDENKYFNFVLIHGCMTASYNLLVLFCCDAMFAVTVQHACGLFSIISYRVKNVSRISRSSYIHNKKENKHYYKDLCYSIQYHNYAIRYATTLEAFYSQFLFFSNGCSLILISVTLMQTLNSIDNTVYILKYGAFAVANIYHVYVLGLPAQDLLQYSSEIGFNMYDCNWYEMPIEARKLIPMIIMQSNRPCKLSIGQLATMNMETVSKVLKMALSYFTMLSSVRQSSKI
ncbi:odorant receptor 9a-like [Leptopilina boulardi]|uniref:odorant receptor 9a-like n=1 Tax=Leptopilina boulardi TaxID=63433 RepID=UPI0021F5209C|nr:odorant receptor 9a-like [Leptopilina boulardi]